MLLVKNTGLGIAVFMLFCNCQPKNVGNLTNSPQSHKNKDAAPTAPTHDDPNGSQPASPTAPKHDDPNGSQPASIGTTGNAAQVFWDWSTITPFTTFRLNSEKTPILPDHVPSLADFADGNYLICPNSSAIVGLQSLLDYTTQDRIYTTKCQFLADGKGRPLTKKNCSYPPNPASSSIGKSWNFSCPNSSQFITGMYSGYSAAKKARGYLFECCELHTTEGTPLFYFKNTMPAPENSYFLPTRLNQYTCASRCTSSALLSTTVPNGPGVNSQVNTPASDFDFICPGNTLLQHIDSTWTADDGGQYGETYSFECCYASTAQPTTEKLQAFAQALANIPGSENTSQCGDPYPDNVNHSSVTPAALQSIQSSLP